MFIVYMLIAAAVVARALEDELLAVAREIGLGVLAAEGQLTDVGEPRTRRAATPRAGPGRLGPRATGPRRDPHPHGQDDKAPKENRNGSHE